jgi:hypothetical protein
MTDAKLKEYIDAQMNNLMIHILDLTKDEKKSLGDVSKSFKDIYPYFESFYAAVVKTSANHSANKKLQNAIKDYNQLFLRYRNVREQLAKMYLFDILDAIIEAAGEHMSEYVRTTIEALRESFRKNSKYKLKMAIDAGDAKDVKNEVERGDESVGSD